jgi:hypothetical protein
MKPVIVTVKARLKSGMERLEFPVLKLGGFSFMGVGFETHPGITYSDFGQVYQVHGEGEDRVAHAALEVKLRTKRRKRWFRWLMMPLVQVPSFIIPPGFGQRPAGWTPGIFMKHPDVKISVFYDKGFEPKLSVEDGVEVAAHVVCLPIGRKAGKK